MTIISLHMPKTAGTSFKASLMSHFGHGYQTDNDFPISKPPEVRHREALAMGGALSTLELDKVACIHGHFLPVKYLALSAVKPLTFVTWLRDPVARLLSHYNYWQASYDPETSAPHHKRVIEEAWTVEQFCLSEQFRNIYSQYLWGVSLENFAFVGVSEHYQEDFRDFCERYLSAHLEPRYENVAKDMRSEIRLNDDFLEEVRSFHFSDMELYRRALEYRNQRLSANADKKHSPSPTV